MGSFLATLAEDDRRMVAAMAHDDGPVEPGMGRMLAGAEAGNLVDMAWIYSYLTRQLPSARQTWLARADALGL